MRYGQDGKERISANPEWSKRAESRGRIAIRKYSFGVNTPTERERESARMRVKYIERKMNECELAACVRVYTYIYIYEKTSGPDSFVSGVNPFRKINLACLHA